MSHITLNGQPIHTIGKLPPVGSDAPDFIVTKTDLSEIKLKNYPKTTIILNIFPSLDTSTCATAMLKFNEMAQDFKHILILCISADLPFAQKRFCAVQHLNNIQPVSVFRHPGFGNDYGVLMTDGPVAGLLSRAIVVIDENGKVIHTQQVKELSDEPDYSAIISLLKASSK